VARPTIRRELLLEEPALLAADELGAGHDARDRGVDLGLNALVLGAEVDDRDVGRHANRVYPSPSKETKAAAAADAVADAMIGDAESKSERVEWAR
jgi:hypothetical protein